MAEAILFDIAADLISKVGSLLMNEIVLWRGVKDELTKLEQTVGTIKSVLLHAEEQSVENPQVKNWLGMLTEVMYDADDLLDEFSTEALRQQVMGGSKISKKVRLFFSSSNQFAFGLKMGHKVKALREQLDEIAANRRFYVEERSYGERGFVLNRRNQTHSSPPEVVIGRESEKEAMVELLLSTDYQENVSTVAIVGIGGLGKTTLAQLVYNNDKIKNHFELKMWVCVSEEFDVQLLAKNVLESASGKVPSSNQMDLLKNCLHEKINGRKYLLVLDDVWDVGVNEWLSFKDLLAGGARGSKIVITTRLRKVAEMSRPIFIHDMKGLSEKEAWLLFKHMAFKQAQAPNLSFEATGKEIVAKCCGVPLAIKTIGGMLYFKDQEFEWLSFIDKELSTIDVYKNDILRILKLSYNNLPSHYKHCFAYCSLYPKDSRISVDELINFWKAQGYLKSTDPDECLQDAGFEYVMDLYRLSFIQDVEKDDYGNIKYCKLHDLMNDLAVSVAGDKFSSLHSGMTVINDRNRHVSYRGCRKFMISPYVSLLKAKKIRTVLTTPYTTFRNVTTNKVLDAVFCNLRCLRVLSLSAMEIDRLPNSICKLKHLRYLDLSHNNYIQKLPNSVSDLPNLQGLNLKWCSNLVQLPSNISKLVNLTDLDNQACKKLNHMPRAVGKLTRLEKLSEFVIAKDHSISRQVGKLDELNSLNELRGKLEIKNLRNTSEFTKGHLSLKHKLQRLTLDWGNNEDEKNNWSGNDVANEEMGMKALCPHLNLKELKVLFYGGEKPPSWLPSITNLVYVRFEKCRSIQWLPRLDQLPCLKKLEVRHLTKLEHIDVGNGGGFPSFFPSLTHLSLEHCPNLKGFEGLSSLSTKELPCFPCLSRLEIRGCLNITCLPLSPDLKKLYLDGNGIESMTMLMKLASKPTSSPFSSLSQLQHLELSNMEDSLEDELLYCLPSLEHLEFKNCSFSNVCSDENDDGMRWQSLNSLRCVEFDGTHNLVALPKGLQYVTTLQRLFIRECPSLACIPDWMPKLTALQNLSIIGCSQLQRRCNNNTAEDWPMISHIPDIEVKWKPIQRNGRYML